MKAIVQISVSFIVLLAFAGCAPTSHSTSADRIRQQLDELRFVAKDCSADTQCQMVSFVCASPCPIAINSSFTSSLLELDKKLMEAVQASPSDSACTVAAACPILLPQPLCIEGKCIGSWR